MTSKRDAIIEEFFQGDDLGFIIGTFDGVLSGTFDTVPETWEIMTGEYREGFLYGKLQLVMDNPLLFSRITTCGATLTFPEVVGTTDLMRGVPIDEDDEAEIERWCDVAFCGMPAAPHTNVCLDCETSLLEERENRD